MYIRKLGGGGGGGEGGATFCDYALCPIFRRWELAAVLQVGPWLPPPPPPLYAALDRRTDRQAIDRLATGVHFEVL